MDSLPPPPIARDEENNTSLSERKSMRLTDTPPIGTPELEGKDDPTTKIPENSLEHSFSFSTEQFADLDNASFLSLFHTQTSQTAISASSPAVLPSSDTPDVAQTVTSSNDVPQFVGFKTAGSKKDITISKASLEFGKKFLLDNDDDYSHIHIDSSSKHNFLSNNPLNNNALNELASSLESGQTKPNSNISHSKEQLKQDKTETLSDAPQFVGFKTAGSKKDITISKASLEFGKKFLLDDDDSSSAEFKQTVESSLSKIERENSFEQKNKEHTFGITPLSHGTSVQKSSSNFHSFLPSLPSSKPKQFLQSIPSSSPNPSEKHPPTSLFSRQRSTQRRFNPPKRISPPTVVSHPPSQPSSISSNVMPPSSFLPPRSSEAMLPAPQLPTQLPIANPMLISFQQLPTPSYPLAAFLPPPPPPVRSTSIMVTPLKKPQPLSTPLLSYSSSQNISLSVTSSSLLQSLPPPPQKLPEVPSSQFALPSVSRETLHTTKELSQKPSFIQSSSLTLYKAQSISIPLASSSSPAPSPTTLSSASLSPSPPSSFTSSSSLIPSHYVTPSHSGPSLEHFIHQSRSVAKLWKTTNIASQHSV